MKKIIFFFLLATVSLNAQTSLSFDDIAAASGNGREFLLTNLEPLQPDMAVTSFLQTNLQMYEDSYVTDDEKFYRVYKDKIVSGEEEPSEVHYKMYLKQVEGHKYGISEKVEIWGDWIPVVKFFCGFWSRSLNFNDVKPGEVVSTRFLTDIATLTFPDANTAKITVVPAKAR